MLNQKKVKVLNRAFPLELLMKFFNPVFGWNINNLYHVLLICTEYEN